MTELRCAFTTFDQWRQWREANKTQEKKITDSIVADVRRWGLIEPVSCVYQRPQDIEIDSNESRLFVSIASGRLNSRKRADLLALEIAVASLPAPKGTNPNILGAEGLTHTARILRSTFPYYLSTEYLPTQQEKDRHYPIPHLDLMDIGFPSDSFDIFFSAHVLEHVPKISVALAEIARTLRPGGVLVSTFPFNPAIEKTVTRARLASDGGVEHLLEPEYHGNPVRPEEGSLVFQAPGWDILNVCADAGLVNPRMLLLASSRHGIAAHRSIGAFALLANKSQD